MKKVLLFCLLVYPFSGYVFSQEATIVQYQPENHTLTLKATAAPISSLVDALSGQGLQLYFADLQEDFPVSANFTDTPIDEALAQIIPANVDYFYRVPEAAENAMIEQTASYEEMVALGAQESGPNRQRTNTKSEMPEAEKLLQETPAIPVSPTAATPAPLPAGPGERMSTDTLAFRSDAPPPTAEISASRVQGRTPPAGEHLVVTFKVTEGSMELVSAAMESGDFIAPDENMASAEYALIGLENNNVVLVEGFDDPLVARSIFDPAQEVDHGQFEQESALIAVRLPKKYAKNSSAKRLSLQLAKVENPDKATIIREAKNRRRNPAARRGLTNEVRTVESMDLSGITITKSE